MVLFLCMLVAFVVGFFLGLGAMFQILLNRDSKAIASSHERMLAIVLANQADELAENAAMGLHGCYSPIATLHRIDVIGERTTRLIKALDEHHTRLMATLVDPYTVENNS